MFKTQLLVLLASIYSSCCEDSSLDNLCLSESTCLQDIIGMDNNKYVDDAKSIKKITALLPFVSLDKCPSMKCNLPYVEFAAVAAFFGRIPQAKKFAPLFETNDSKATTAAASKIETFSNYDYLNPFFFNADAKAGLCKVTFDANFILYFLQRFYYFLDIYLVNKTCVVSGTNCYSSSDKKDISFLDIPRCFSNINFGSEENALKIFNMIVTDTTITKEIVSFCKILLRQIEAARTRCVKESSKPFNTYTTYLDVLEAHLRKTIQVAEFNYTIKLDWLVGQDYKIAFITLPVVDENATPKPIAGVPNKLLFSEVDFDQYMSDIYTAMFL